MANFDVAVTEAGGYRRLYPDYWSLSETTLVAGCHTSSHHQHGAGFRFQNVTIPQGATIDSAYITFESRAVDSGANCKTRISAEDVDDAIAIADDKAAFDTRWAARTTARVDWDNIAAWAIGSHYDSPSITTVIQEIVDRVGWASGNNIVIFWEDFEDRSTHANANNRDAYNYNSGDAPHLYITYTVVGWTGKIGGVTNPGKINGVSVVNIAKVNGVVSS